MIRQGETPMSRADETELLDRLIASLNDADRVTTRPVVPTAGPWPPGDTTTSERISGPPMAPLRMRWLPPLRDGVHRGGWDRAGRTTLVKLLRSSCPR